MKGYKLLLLLLIITQLAASLLAQVTGRTEGKLKEKAGETSPCTIGGVSLSPQECKELLEQLHQRNLARYSPPGFSRAYGENDIKLLENLEPLVEKLDKMVFENATISDLERPKPRKSLGRNIHIQLKEDDDFKYLSNVSLRLWVYDSLRRAEQGLAENASALSVGLNSGSLTGKEIGELSYHYSEENRIAYIILLRRNVVVSISYKGPSGIPKDPKRPAGQFLDDPELKNKCDALAMKLDGFIVNLTNN